MGLINYGNQSIGLAYGSAATSLLVNFVEYGIVPPGIYVGGVLSNIWLIGQFLYLL